MIDLRALPKRISYCVPNRALIPALVPMFLILSSSVYPAIISSMENKEMLIAAEVIAQLKGKDKNSDTSNLHSTMSFSSSQDVMPSSPTPIGPTLSAASSASNESTTLQQKQQYDEDAEMDATAISEGDTVHVVWGDSTTGNGEIFYKRDGADFDPTTINLSNSAGLLSESPAIAVSGNNVYIVWHDDTLGNFEIFYRRSFDGGATFGPIINLSNNAETSRLQK